MVNNYVFVSSTAMKEDHADIKRGGVRYCQAHRSNVVDIIPQPQPLTTRQLKNGAFSRKKVPSGYGVYHCISN